MRYLDLHLPPRFQLEVRDGRGEWTDLGSFRRRDFERLDDGAYVCGDYSHSPVYLRCIAHRDGYFEHVDQGGHGDIYAYRIVPTACRGD